MDSAPSRTDYRIVDIGGRRILVVLCGSAAIYEFRTELTPAEYDEIQASGSATPALVDAIRMNSGAFAAREFRPT